MKICRSFSFVFISCLASSEPSKTGSNPFPCQQVVRRQEPIPRQNPFEDFENKKVAHRQKSRPTRIRFFCRLPRPSWIKIRRFSRPQKGQLKCQVVCFVRRSSSSKLGWCRCLTVKATEVRQQDVGDTSRVKTWSVSYQTIESKSFSKVKVSLIRYCVLF